jgi:hypothetical protein
MRRAWAGSGSPAATVGDNGLSIRTAVVYKG